MTPFTAKTFTIPALKGISVRTTEEHLKLYAGYVKHANIITTTIAEMSKYTGPDMPMPAGTTYAINEMRRRFSFEFNGMRNHEYYFEQLEGGQNMGNMESALAQQMKKDFGSSEAWFEEFKKTHGREPTRQDRPAWFVSANDLSPEDHVYVQATIQKYVDASISKTVNAPATHTVEDVKRLYTLAYEQGCKGIAYMREGSRAGVLTRKEEKPAAVVIPSVPEVKPRPVVLHGATYRVETPVGDAYVTINTNGGNQPVEMFVNVGKAGSDVTAMAEALGKIISLTLRMASPIPPMERAHKIASMLIGIGGARSLGFGENRVRSLPDAIAKVIDRHFGFFKSHRVDVALPATTVQEAVAKLTSAVSAAPVFAPPPEAPQASVATSKRMVTVDLCPKCGEASLVFEESCKKCYSCGYSEC